jgi:hypothetical protein
MNIRIPAATFPSRRDDDDDDRLQRFLFFRRNGSASEAAQQRKMHETHLINTSAAGRERRQVQIVNLTRKT